MMLAKTAAERNNAAIWDSTWTLSRYGARRTLRCEEEGRTFACELTCQGMTTMQNANASAPPQDFNYIIQTTRDGHLDDVSPHAHVVDVFERAIASSLPIVIHLHGGLVPKESAYQTVNLLQPKYVAAGFFPIFIVWRTGLFDAVKSAGELVHRPIFARLLERLL